MDYQNGAEPSRAGTNGEAATRAGTLQGAAAAGGNGVSHDKRALLKVPPSRRAAPRELRRVAPGVPRALSFAQERLFVLHELAPGLVAYNTPIVLRLRGSLDIAALRRTCDELLRRHEVLRTTVRLDGDDLRVEVLEDVAVPFSLTVLPDALSEEGIRAAVEGEVRRPFDLGRDVLLRAQLFRVADDDHVVVLASHHIASDEVSKRILTKELSALYASFVNDEPSPLPGPALGYADYAAWQ
ncbi:MAG TPA: condensation domain-containing protein, partial [Acidimicrobiales bacterium]|nr:condensation domain-containing protein [Acidimicrobiales bacterium]